MTGNYLKIPGETPLPFQRPPQPRLNVKALVVLVLFSLLCAGGFFLAKYWRSLLPPTETSEASVPRVAKPVSSTIPMADTEDLLHHLEAADAQALQAEAEMKRSEQWITRISPALEMNYMSGEKRRLDAGLATLESARQSVEQAREELENTKNLLIERSK